MFWVLGYKTKPKRKKNNKKIREEKEQWNCLSPGA
jgi:hypothetical protein